MPKFYVGRNDGTIEKQVFDTYDQAVDCIARFQLSDPNGVIAGDYYIDPPENWTGKKRPTLDAFTRAYLECALWTSDPDPGSGEWSEHDDWTIDNIDPESLARAIEVCADFQQANRADLDEVSDTFHADDSQHGHDFWLTRNGHGAGFWDRGYGELGEKLTKASKPYGEAYVYGPETDPEDGESVSDEAYDAWDGVIRIED